ncbi:MAG: primosomal protein N', partial [Deltaproteobacteria bacterium]
MKKFAEIAVELPIENTFTYSIPPYLADMTSIGKRALVPFGRRTVTGFVTAIHSSEKPCVRDVEIKGLLDILDGEPVFDEKRLAFYRWVSSYYFSPLGEVLALTHPASINIKSRRHLALTESGRAALSIKSGLDLDILTAAKERLTISTVQKRLKRKPLYSAIERLKKEGLIREETRLKGGGNEKTEVYLSVSATYPDVKRSPAQAKVLNHLLNRGETPLSVLREELGAAGNAVKRLIDKGIVRAEARRVLRDPFSDMAPKSAPYEPNGEQKAAIAAITGALSKNSYSPFLLYGVTGSGKTLVYLKALQEAVRLGKKAIILAPEIALTPWPAAYLRYIFPDRVAIYHSGLSEGERFDEWMRILNGEADIVVGARSALFCPVKGLGLIIVDEEHEASYKQEEGVRYNARDCALMLGRHLGITVVLGSATPSVETFHNARRGRITELRLENRVSGRALPDVEISDMRGRKGTVLSERLIGLMKKTFEKKEQALLFLNRRGFSSSIICRDCGFTFMCLNCNVTLTMHKRGGVLKCHYCDSSVPIPDECPACRGVNLIQPGAGTEKVEEEVRTIFPEVNPIRMDRDTTARKGAAREIIDAVEAKKADVLIGTQMVSKGHHFPGVTLAGIISGDTSLSIPDFRSSERTFQLITQAAGRAGRGDAPGIVILQTLNPEHYCFKNALRHDYESFYEEEIRLREEAGYPPFTRLCNIRIDGLKEERVIGACKVLKGITSRLLKKEAIDLQILGPAPALLTRIKNRYRYQMLVNGSNVKDLHRFVKGLKAAFEAK